MLPYLQIGRFPRSVYRDMFNELKSTVKNLKTRFQVEILQTLTWKYKEGTVGKRAETRKSNSAITYRHFLLKI